MLKERERERERKNFEKMGSTVNSKWLPVTTTITVALALLSASTAAISRTLPFFSCLL